MKTLLDGVNEVLKRASVINGDNALLTTLADDARQVDIDQAVQVINEAIDELFSTTDRAVVFEQAESTITLVAGTRAYSLANDVSQLRWPLVDRTNNQFIVEYGAGYNSLLLVDVPQTATGLPRYGAIRPTDGKLYLDMTPTSAENGRVYYYQYDKDTGLDAASDEMPFDDPVFRAMVPAWVQLWKRERRGEFDVELYKGSMGRAARLMTMAEPRDSYNPRPSAAYYQTDPYSRD